MPLRNRVTPFSTIESVPQRGLFMGNRGCLHDENRELITDGWRTRTWLICSLSFQGRRRQLMSPHSYTELFFLDEAVALAAGHRPCWLCRRDAYQSFISLWSSATHQPPRAALLDDTLHRERVPPIRHKHHYHQARLSTLPDGTFVVLPEQPTLPWLKLNRSLLAWSHAGYTHAILQPSTSTVSVLTPSSTLLALRAGYQPVLHPSLKV